MKKLGLMVVLVILAFCVSAISCGQVGGSFTLTGIPSQYNGKYVFLEGEHRDGELLGCVSVNVETEEVKLPRISNGRVSIPMWVFNVSSNSVSKYSGSNTVEYLEIMICDSDDGDDAIAEIEFEDIVFKNGKATKSWNEGEVWD